MLDYPSPIIEIQPPGISDHPSVAMPRDEVFRLRNIFENHEYAIPAQFLPSGSLTVVDIGANVGLFALYMKHTLADCDIICFEPAPQTVQLLEKNIADHRRIHVFPFALSDHDDQARLHLHPCNSGENSLKNGGNHSGKSVQIEIKDAATVFHQLGLNYIDILKIDTEGCEVEILNSLRAYLPYVGIIMAEFHSEQDRRKIDALLQNHSLFDARIYSPQLGTVKYINSRLI